MKLKTIFLTSILGSTSALGAQIPVSVHEFKDKSGTSNCRYDWDRWHDLLGSAFQEMLVNELTKSPEIQVLERAKIESVYENEHKLINSENSPKPQKGKFKVAKYVIVGALSEYEYCASGNNVGVDVGALAGFGSLVVGRKSNSASIAVDIRVIDVESGKVVKTVRGEGKVKDQKLSLDSDMAIGNRSAKGDFSSQKSSPIGKAARKAIENAAEEIREYLATQV